MGWTRSDLIKETLNLTRNEILKGIDILYELEYIARRFNGIGISMDVDNGSCKGSNGNSDILFITFERSNPIYSIPKILENLSSNELFVILDKNRIKLNYEDGKVHSIFKDGVKIFTHTPDDVLYYLYKYCIDLDGNDIRDTTQGYTDPYSTIRLQNCVNNYVIYSHYIDTDESHRVCVNLKFYSDLNSYLNYVLNHIDDYKLSDHKYELKHSNLIT
jgi:hypothetical protein